MLNMKNILANLCILLLFYDLATCVIIPEELPTILSVIYSNIPPIKKGTDSRLGVGFRLGEHADFQVLVELGPQTNTDPIGNAASNSKRRRDAMFDAAMRGELGSLAQAVAKYQLERKLRKELEKLKKTRGKIGAVDVKESDDKKTTASEWLSKWSKVMVPSPENQASLQNTVNEKDSPKFEGNKKTIQRIGRPPLSNDVKSTIADLTTLYKVQSNETNEAI